MLYSWREKAAATDVPNLAKMIESGRAGEDVESSQVHNDKTGMVEDDNIPSDEEAGEFYFDGEIPCEDVAAAKYVVPDSTNGKTHLGCDSAAPNEQGKSNVDCHVGSSEPAAEAPIE